MSWSPWRDFGARIVLMRPDGKDMTVPEGVTAVCVPGVTDRRLARLAGHVLLIRPDRYVAACVAVDDLTRGAEAVARLVRGTFG